MPRCRELFGQRVVAEKVVLRHDVAQAAIQVFIQYRIAKQRIVLTKLIAQGKQVIQVLRARLFQEERALRRAVQGPCRDKRNIVAVRQYAAVRTPDRITISIKKKITILIRDRSGGFEGRERIAVAEDWRRGVEIKQRIGVETPIRRFLLRRRAEDHRKSRYKDEWPHWW